jgi:hypothetical protein
MSFEEYDDCFIWRCDERGCGREVIFPPKDFWDCVAELKSRGWGFSPPEGEIDWTHCCGRCRSKRPSIMDRTFSKPREVKG